MTALTTILRDGSLSWVSASAYENGWTTAATSPSGINIAFVEGFQFGSGQQVAVQYNRSRPVHQRVTQFDAPVVSFNTKFLASALPDYPIHIEWRVAAPDQSAFYQFHHCIRTQGDISESQDANMYNLSFQAIGLVGPTASGFLAH